MKGSSATTSGGHRLTLVISSLGAGGAQRVMALLANHWVEQGWSVTLLTLDDGSEAPFFPVHTGIDHRHLGLYAVSGGWWRRVCNNLRRLMVLRRAIGQGRPQAVISFMDRTNILVLCATLWLRVPVIVAEHTAVGVVNLGWIWGTLRRLVYPHAAAIVVLTERGLRILPSGWRKQAVVIPNPVFPPPGPDGRMNGEPEKICLAMGSLRPEKGFDLLLLAFAEAIRYRPHWKLVILGEGGGEAALKELASQLDIADRVCFPGLVAEPRPYLKSAKLFVLSSRIEGFPMALCEAMACGLPVVATDCATGPREIVRDGIDGLLVEPENVPALAAAIGRLMDDNALRQRMGERATEVLERFGLPQVAALWEALLLRVTGRS